MEALQSGNPAPSLPLESPVSLAPTDAFTAIIAPTISELTPPALGTPAPNQEQDAPSATPEPVFTEAPVPSPSPEVAATAAPLPSATPPLATIAVATLPPQSNEARWRNQQIDRSVFPQVAVARTTGSELWWFDPVNQQHLLLGSFAGEFPAQARFTLRGQGAPALEVPYQVNRSFGLTALSPAVLSRITAAGYGEWIETYVFITPNVVLNDQ